MLSEIAESNLNKVMRKGMDWKVYCCDAGMWTHYSDYNIFYIFNSFPKKVINEVKD